MEIKKSDYFFFYKNPYHYANRIYSFNYNNYII